MNIIGVSILAILIPLVLFGSRRWAALGMVMGVLYLTQAQMVDVLSLHMTAMRFLELAGFGRVMARREFSFSRLNGVDQTFLLLYSYTAIVYSLRATEGQAYVIGASVDACLCYFTFRGLITDIEDFRWFLRAFVVLLIPYVTLVLVESFTLHNPYWTMSGLSLKPWMRAGRVRCTGSFRYASLLGTLGGSFAILYIGLVLTGTEGILAWIGVGLSLVIVWAANSGGPASFVAIGLLGWLMWRVRTRMRLVRWGIVGAIVLGALLMKAPVWYLLSRVSDFTGGDGWHRAYLVDVTVRNIDKWWIAGMPIEETSTWFPYTISSTGAADLTNAFISFGINAGLGAVVLFIWLFVRAFSGLGKALATVRSDSAKNNSTEILLWGLGVMLAAHIVNLMAVIYFDHFYVFWFMQLAVVSGLAERCAEPVQAETEELAIFPGEGNTIES
jgi:hypothetical protein